MSEPNVSKTIRIGREPGNDIVLNSPSVSRNHAVISYNGSSYRIMDNNSANGVYVNGIKVFNTEIYRSDRITLGSSVELSWHQIDASLNAFGSNPMRGNQPVYQSPPYYQPNHSYPQQSKVQSNTTLWIVIGAVAVLFIGGMSLLLLKDPVDPKPIPTPAPVKDPVDPVAKPIDPKPISAPAPVTEYIRILKQGQRLSPQTIRSFCDNYERGRGSYDLAIDVFSRFDPDDCYDYNSQITSLSLKPSDLRVANQGGIIAILGFTDSGINRLNKQLEGNEEYLDPEVRMILKEEIKIYMIKENGRWKRFLYKNDIERKIFDKLLAAIQELDEENEIPDTLDYGW